MNSNYPFVVLVSANSEWKPVLECLLPQDVGVTPFGQKFSANIGGHPVLFAHGGWGKTASTASCQYLIDRYHPQLILNLGTCGGLVGHAEVGEILLAEETALYDIVEGMSDYSAAIEHYRTQSDLSWLPAALPPGVRKARIVSADQDIQTQNFDLLVDNFQAPAADWESASFAWTAAKNKTPWLVLRGVSDLVGKDKAEAYQNVELWRERAAEIMAKLLKLLPWFLDRFPAAPLSY